MGRLLWLPDVLRAAGLTVHEVDGRQHDGKTWRSRGADTFGPVRGITCHHTAGSRTSTVAGEIRTLLVGSTSAPPPIAQLLLDRAGNWHVVASGTCNHNRVGWAGPNEGYGNDALLGIEAQHSGAGEPWTDVQYQSYVRGVAALVRHKAPGWDVTVARVAGHKEHQPGAKSDPTFDMDQFRRDVAAVLAGEDDDVDAKTIEEIAYRTKLKVLGDGGIQTLITRVAAMNKAMEALVAATPGVDGAEILAEIRRLAAEDERRDAELADLVRQVDTGERDAAEVVRLIGERLAGGTAQRG